MKAKELAKRIDHTQLKPNATMEDIRRLCEEAKRYGFYAVCVSPFYVKFAKEFLKGTDIKVVSVVGFPLGNTYTEVKVLEAKKAVENGADEIDMVMNVSAFKSKMYEYVEDDIRAVVNAVKPIPVKVIIETCYLTDDEKLKATEIAIRAGAAFVKTSTGFGPEGAKVEDIALIKREFGDKIKIKASGGIRDAKTAIAMIKAGADRIGASKGVQIIESLKELEEV
ncbi:MAG: deoxyribose-phosphate aldolase [Euryarchaeota archaeon]|nr:deoxyribose-phosphate aldolase [Euryarchaeota archaeon]